MQLCEGHHIVLSFSHTLHLGTVILRDSEGNATPWNLTQTWKMKIQKNLFKL